MTLIEFAFHKSNTVELLVTTTLFRDSSLDMSRVTRHITSPGFLNFRNQYTTE